ncbi:hypothetical protein O0H34_03100 [Staphylococcus pseudintermedius]|uniref:hypothetical protein n=1 Tax=Staphylococcus pseudintermedius TaxID=283734 RepID=UPI001F55A2D9|nr:hypothetical protein [Staphylococcus pseudintermedius]MDE9923328.1 hypothetical protein [Staphylococcus pseudintermedius]MDE9929669.1 hypothetical protein [Staphylococcus pseudintermedius]MDE9932353.1 hypothetical protein [Staphylococcus pseudintermedius]MDE9934326.1 hypothetical protein [Staphylococcus pseudintermedius]
MKKSFLKFSSTFLLLTTIGMTGTNAANVWGAEEGTKVIVEDTKMDTIGKRTAIFEGPKGLPCTSTMLTSNFGITAAHCGNGFQEGSVGTVYPAQSGLSTPFGSMSITLFNPYENKDVAFVYGPDNGKSRDYIYYQKEFASTEITLEGLSDEELYQLVGKKCIHLVIHIIIMVINNINLREKSLMRVKILLKPLYQRMVVNPVPQYF